MAITGEQLLEIKRCMMDSQHWYREYVWWYDSSDQTEFKVGERAFPYQYRTFDRFIYSTAKTLYADKSRQGGVSWVAVSAAVYMALFKPNTKVCFVSKRGDNGRQARELMQRVRYILSKLPAWMQPRVRKNNESELVLANNSAIMSYSLSSNTGRGTNATVWILDEAMFYEPFWMAEKAWRAILPTIGQGKGRAIIISTPEYGNIFADMALKLRSGELGAPEFEHIRIEWRERLDRLVNSRGENDNGEEFKARMIAQFGLRAWEVEFEGVLRNTAGSCVFAAEDQVIRTQMRRPTDPAFTTGMDFKTAIERGVIECVIGVDSSEGIAEDNTSDYCGSTLWARDPATDLWHNIDHLHGRWKPDAYAMMIERLAVKWGKPLLVVENNSVGGTVLAHLINRGYPATKLWRDHDGNLGWRTSPANREPAILDFEEGVRLQRYLVGSEPLQIEMTTFVEKVSSKTGRTKREHMPGKHDDLLMSGIIAMAAVRKRRTARVSASRPAGL